MHHQRPQTNEKLRVEDANKEGSANGRKFVIYSKEEYSSFMDTKRKSSMNDTGLLSRDGGTLSRDAIISNNEAQNSMNMFTMPQTKILRKTTSSSLSNFKLEYNNLKSKTSKRTWINVN